MASPEETLAHDIEAEMDKQVAEAKADSGASASAAPEALDSGSVVADTTKCAKCKTEGKVAEMICRPSFRIELRHICRPCNAIVVQFQRKGAQLTELINEDSMVAFFSERALERKHAEDGRLLFSRARAQC